MVILTPLISGSYYTGQDSRDTGGDIKPPCCVPDVTESGSNIPLLNVMFYPVRKRISFDRCAFCVKEVAFPC